MNLKELREAAGLSQEDMASALGRSYNSIRGWEAGRGEPYGKASEMPKFLKAYKCSLDEFVKAINETMERKKNKS